MANKGLVVGRVIGANGGWAPGATVALYKIGLTGDVWLQDEKGNLRRRVFGETNKNGLFRIKFSWSGADIADAVTPPFLYLTAYSDAVSKSGYVTTSAVTAKANVQARGYIIKNVLEMTQSAISTFKAQDDLKDFAEEFANFAVGASTTESWLLVGAAYIFLA